MDILGLIKRVFVFAITPFRRRIVENNIDKKQDALLKNHEPANDLVTMLLKAEDICDTEKNDFVLGEYFTHNNPWVDRPWKDFNYWNGWYALTKLKAPEYILEIGTAFGFSTVALIRGAEDKLKMMVSLDLGNFGGLFASKGSSQIDNLDYVKEGIEEYRANKQYDFEYRQFVVNTQPPPLSDNENHLVSCPYWRENKDLDAMLDTVSFDMILIDGKHTDSGLYNDLAAFFPYCTSGGVIICDDLQHLDAINSMQRFINENGDKIKDFTIWRFLKNNAEYGGTLRRDQGILIKK